MNLNYSCQNNFNDKNTFNTQSAPMQGVINGQTHIKYYVSSKTLFCKEN